MPGLGDTTLKKLENFAIQLIPIETSLLIIYGVYNTGVIIIMGYTTQGRL
jgi:hypothetical protein